MSFGETENSMSLPSREDSAPPLKVSVRPVDETGELLAFGSTSGGLWISENGGDSWTMPEARLPPIAAVRFAPAEH